MTNNVNVNKLFMSHLFTTSYNATINGVDLDLRAPPWTFTGDTGVNN